MYKTIFNNLQNWNCTIDKTISRFLNDEDFYYKCLCEFSNDENFENIKQSIFFKDYQKVFECAHSLKGVSANLGLTPIYDCCAHIVDTLRYEVPLDADEKLENYYEKLDLEREKLVSFLNISKK